MGERAVPAIRPDAKPESDWTLLTEADRRQAAGLRDQTGVAQYLRRAIHKIRGTAAAQHDFVGNGAEGQRSGDAPPHPVQIDIDRQGDRETAFHIRCAAPPNLSAMNDATPGIVRPCFGFCDGKHVHVTVEDKGPAVRAARKRRDDIRTLLIGRAYGKGQPLRIETGGNAFCHRPGFARRIRALRPDEIASEIQQFLPVTLYPLQKAFFILLHPVLYPAVKGGRRATAVSRFRHAGKMTRRCCAERYRTNEIRSPIGSASDIVGS